VPQHDRHPTHWATYSQDQSLVMRNRTPDPAFKWIRKDSSIGILPRISLIASKKEHDVTNILSKRHEGTLSPGKSRQNSGFGAKTAPPGLPQDSYSSRCDGVSICHIPPAPSLPASTCSALIEAQ